jgi:hypothetical protein
MNKRNGARLVLVIVVIGIAAVFIYRHATVSLTVRQNSKASENQKHDVVPDSKTSRASTDSQDDLVTLNDVKPPISDADTYVHYPLANDLDDVSQWETPFKERISLQPLLTSQVNVARYKTEITSRTIHTADGLVDPNTFVNTIEGYKRLESFDRSSPDQIKYHEILGLTGHPELKEMDNVRINSVDGRYLDEPGSIAIRPGELDPLYPETAVAKGDSWKQKLAVDPELNPNGQVEARVSVESTYTKEAHRYARIRRDMSFVARQPDVQNAGEADKDGSRVMSIRVNEVYDMDLDTGIHQSKSTFTRMYFKSQGSLDGHVVGSIVDIVAKETLVSSE